MVPFRLHIPGIVYHPDQAPGLTDRFCFSVRGVTSGSFVTAVLSDLSRHQEVWLPDPDRDCSRIVRLAHGGFETRLVCHGAFNDAWHAVSREEAEHWLTPAVERMLETEMAEGWIHWQPDGVATADGHSSPTGFSKLWADRYETQRDQYARMLNGDLWMGWADDPEMNINLELSQGIRVLLGGDLPTARRYFERGLAICQRADRELPCAPPTGELEPALARPYPLNHARRARYHAHLCGFLEMPGAHAAAMQGFHASAQDYVAYEAADARGTWGEMGQGRTLDAARLLLLRSDNDAAASVLKSRRKFGFHAEEHGILLDLAKGDRTPRVRERLQTFFDRIRNPQTKMEASRDVDLVPIEVALLLDRLFDHPDGQLHWLRAAMRVGH